MVSTGLMGKLWLRIFWILLLGLLLGVGVHHYSSVECQEQYVETKHFKVLSLYPLKGKVFHSFTIFQAAFHIAARFSRLDYVGQSHVLFCTKIQILKISILINSSQFLTYHQSMAMVLQSRRYIWVRNCPSLFGILAFWD